MFSFLWTYWLFIANWNVTTAVHKNMMARLNSNSDVFTWRCLVPKKKQSISFCHHTNHSLMLTVASKLKIYAYNPQIPGGKYPFHTEQQLKFRYLLRPVYDCDIFSSFKQIDSILTAKSKIMMSKSYETDYVMKIYVREIHSDYQTSPVAPNLVSCVYMLE